MPNSRKCRTDGVYREFVNRGIDIERSSDAASRWNAEHGIIRAYSDRPVVPATRRDMPNANECMRLAGNVRFVQDLLFAQETSSTEPFTP